MTSFRVFGFYNGDPDGHRDELRSHIPEARLKHVAEWIAFRRFDHALIELTDDSPFPANVIHHVCSDIRCPGGCGYDDDSRAAASGL